MRPVKTWFIKDHSLKILQINYYRVIHKTQAVVYNKKLIKLTKETGNIWTITNAKIKFLCNCNISYGRIKIGVHQKYYCINIIIP